MTKLAEYHAQYYGEFASKERFHILPSTMITAQKKNAVAAIPTCISQTGSLGWLWLDPRLQGGVGSAVQGHALNVGSQAQEGQTERLCWELSHVASSDFSG